MITNNWKKKYIGIVFVHDNKILLEVFVLIYYTEKYYAVKNKNDSY